MTTNEQISLLEIIQTASSVEEIHDACSKACDVLGFDTFIYGARIPTSFTRPHLFIISGYPAEWRERYTALNYIAIDPTVQYCSRNTLPLHWSQIQDQQQQDVRVREFMKEARDFDLRNGVSFAVHNAQGEFAMLSLASADESDSIRRQALAIAPFGQLFIAYLHEKVRKIIDTSEIPGAETLLSDREKECLLWAADGKTSWEISQILKISERTVIHYLQCATEKLEVSNRQQAVARAVSRGLISPRLG